MWTLNPLIESTRRKQPGRITRGDGIRTSLDLGDVRFLEKLIGPGFQLAKSVPLLPAISASVALLNGSSETDSHRWEPSRLSLTWMSEASLTGRVFAGATVARTDVNAIRVAIEADINGKRIYRGELVFSPVNQCSGVTSGSAATSLFTAVRAPGSIALGTAEKVILSFASGASVDIILPYGHGIRAPGGLHFDAQPGLCQFELVADRPQQVNLGKPWRVVISARHGDLVQEMELAIRVPDPEPGRTYYILTQDCETFDGGPLTGDYGTAAEFGNHNNFMDPEDYRIQMVAKPEKMNEIAEKHGACWTHFWAAHQRFAAEWASTQSSTGQWNLVVEALDASIRQGSLRHEYAPHLHCDYDPDCALPPQPRLRYDAETDGILPTDYYDSILNPTHRYHDWDGAARGGPGIKPLGQWDDLQSKSGSLFKALHYIAGLQVQNRGTICGRAGSFDFGGTPDDQAISTEAYEQVGLLANSDARLSGDKTLEGGHLYWCRQDDRSRPVDNLQDVRLVQLAVTCEVGFESLDEANDWFTRHTRSCRGPGVHGLVLMTHAMFMRGVPDSFRSLEGGTFENLDRHLAWVREHYPDIEFATASDAVVEFLDYYTPKLLAVVDPRLIDGDPENGFYVFGVHLLGKGIFVSDDHPATVALAAPACFQPSEILSVEAWVGSEVFTRLDSADISVQVRTRQAAVRLAIRVREEAIPRLTSLFLSDNSHPFHDFHERPKPDLLRLERADRYRYMHALSLLTNPIAGGSAPCAEPGALALILPIGAALHEAAELTSGAFPSALEATFAVGPLDLGFSVVADRLNGGVRVTIGCGDDPVNTTVDVHYSGRASIDRLSRWSQWRTKAARLTRLLIHD